MQAVTRYAIALAALATVALCTGELHAQAPWVDRNTGRGVEFSFARPGIEGSEQALLSGAARFAGTFPIRGNTLVHVELPVARAGFEGESNTMVGAPYIGLVGGAPQKDVRYQIGVRLAMRASDGDLASIIGALTDYEHYEAYLTDLIGIRTSMQFGRVSESGLLAQVRLGGTLLIPTGGDGFDREAFVDYGARVGTETARGFLIADVSGRMLASASNLSFRERTVHFVGLSGGVAVGQVTPAVEVRFPINEEFNDMDMIVRVGARVRW